MVRFGASTGRVQLSGARGAMPVRIDVRLAVNDARTAQLNGSVLSSAEQLRAELHTLVFTPDRLAVVKGGPATRRAYVDRVLGRLLPRSVAATGQLRGGDRAAQRRTSPSGDRGLLAGCRLALDGCGRRARQCAGRSETRSARSPFGATRAVCGLPRARSACHRLRGRLSVEGGHGRAPRPRSAARCDGPRRTSPRDPDRVRWARAPSVRITGRATRCGPRARAGRGRGARRARRRRSARAPRRRPLASSTALAASRWRR